MYNNLLKNSNHTNELKIFYNGKQYNELKEHFKENIHFMEFIIKNCTFNTRDTKPTTGIKSIDSRPGVSVINDFFTNTKQDFSHNILQNYCSKIENKNKEVCSCYVLENKECDGNKNKEIKACKLFNKFDTDDIQGYSNDHKYYLSGCDGSTSFNTLKDYINPPTTIINQVCKNINNYTDVTAGEKIDIENKCKQSATVVNQNDSSDDVDVSVDSGSGGSGDSGDEDDNNFGFGFINNFKQNNPYIFWGSIVGCLAILCLVFIALLFYKKSKKPKK